jgi:hypothetical protein
MASRLLKIGDRVVAKRKLFSGYGSYSSRYDISPGDAGTIDGVYGETKSPAPPTASVKWDKLGKAGKAFYPQKHLKLEDIQKSKRRFGIGDVISFTSKCGHQSFYEVVNNTYNGYSLYMLEKVNQARYKRSNQRMFCSNFYASEFERLPDVLASQIKDATFSEEQEAAVEADVPLEPSELVQKFRLYLMVEKLFPTVVDAFRDNDDAHSPHNPHAAAIKFILNAVATKKMTYNDLLAFEEDFEDPKFISKRFDKPIKSSFVRKKPLMDDWDV